MRKNKLNNTICMKSKALRYHCGSCITCVSLSQRNNFIHFHWRCVCVQQVNIKKKIHAIQIRVIPLLPGDLEEWATANPLLCTEFNSHFKQSTAHVFRLRAVCSKGNRNATISPHYTSTAQSHILIVFLGCRPWVARWCAQQSTDAAAGSAIPCLQSTRRRARDQWLLYLFKLIALRIH